ncbi:metallophosphoesterase [Alkalicoccus halolimnae]|uniref:Metallophosphoesterase n=1 Tax=Alkalicoccus halolimnae TaxID=1667239 RepID=A0A5C7F522_9BACI|nr:metallophosphoesterase [Alkalicoccus halolimnae]TXF83578.1 metallophosphoesterase [Alkalicoccus halolimnae]
MKKKAVITACSLLLLTGVGAFFVYVQNNALTTSEHTLQLNGAAGDFGGFTIIHLSDLHGKSFGKEQRTLVKRVEAEKPDMILFTGDLIDSNRGGADAALTLMDKMTDLAPVYFVNGNHEWQAGNWDMLKQRLQETGVRVLSNQSETIKAGEETIRVAGIEDPASGSESYPQRAVTEENIKEVMNEEEKEPVILLAHRPENFSLYTAKEFDLVLSGHAHGGQFRLPIAGGLIAPDQGFLPSYTSGAYEESGTTMIVSRGLGNSVIPIRVFNRPEVVKITLE